MSRLSEEVSKKNKTILGLREEVRESAALNKSRQELIEQLKEELRQGSAKQAGTDDDLAVARDKISAQETEIKNRQTTIEELKNRIAELTDHNSRYNV